MKIYLPLLVLFFTVFSVSAQINHDQYKSLVWQDLKVINPQVKDVFVNVSHAVDKSDIVIPAFVVKSWMKDLQGNSVYFLSAQPYVCEHSPPPYANQMIKIISEVNLESFADNGTPIYAFGNISIDTNKAGLFSSAYTIKLHDTLQYTGAK